MGQIGSNWIKLDQIGSYYFIKKIWIPKYLQSWIYSQSCLCQKNLNWSKNNFSCVFKLYLFWGLEFRGTCSPKRPTNVISATVNFHNLAYMKDTTLSICSTYVQAKSHEMPCMLDIHAKDNEYPQISFRYFSVHYHLKPKISFLLLIHILR